MTTLPNHGTQLFGGCFSDCALYELYTAIATGDFTLTGREVLLKEANAILDTTYTNLRIIIVNAYETEWQDDEELPSIYAPCAYYEFMNLESTNANTGLPNILKYAAIFCTNEK